MICWESFCQERCDDIWLELSSDRGCLAQETTNEQLSVFGFYCSLQESKYVGQLHVRRGFCHLIFATIRKELI